MGRKHKRPLLKEPPTLADVANASENLIPFKLTEADAVSYHLINLIHERLSQLEQMGEVESFSRETDQDGAVHTLKLLVAPNRVYRVEVYRSIDEE